MKKSFENTACQFATIRSGLGGLNGILFFDPNMCEEFTDCCLMKCAWLRQISKPFDTLEHTVPLLKNHSAMI